MKRKFAILILMTVALTAGMVVSCKKSGGEEAVQGFQLVREVEGIREFKLLSNGLRVLACENHAAPVATVMLVYRVGTRHETEGRTGGSHMLEHMMFKGTPRHSREKGNSLFMLLQQTGAIVNATTGMDVTSFYATVPRERIPLVLELESDRMRNAMLRPEDFEVEREVVLNELEMLDNSPATAFQKGVWRTAYREHPYRNLAIGRVEDLRAMTVTDLKHFYDEYYRPDNACLIAVGDFDTEKLLGCVREKFSGIAHSPVSRQSEIPLEP
jgi:zinc protease